jgi:hypothetical protein
VKWNREVPNRCDLGPCTRGVYTGLIERVKVNTDDNEDKLAGGEGRRNGFSVIVISIRYSDWYV